MMSTDIRPLGITINRSDTDNPFMEIEWSNGQSYQYPLSHLREACPCAECRGGHHNMGLENAPTNLLTLTPARSYDLVGLQQVGNYAIQPTWDDGHSSGIFTWEFLLYIAPDNITKDDK